MYYVIRLNTESDHHWIQFGYFIQSESHQIIPFFDIRVKMIISSLTRCILETIELCLIRDAPLRFKIYQWLVFAGHLIALTIMGVTNFFDMWHHFQMTHIGGSLNPNSQVAAAFRTPNSSIIVDYHRGKVRITDSFLTTCNQSDVLGIHSMAFYAGADDLSEILVTVLSRYLQKGHVKPTLAVEIIM